MQNRFLIFFVLILHSLPAWTFELIFWNVGQGQWATLVGEHYCLHFDMGGEHAPLNRIKKLCQNKTEMLFLSHWDWDHRSFILPYSRGQNLCLQSLPLEPKGKKKHKQILDICKTSVLLPVQKIFAGRADGTSNSTSRVFYEPQTRSLFPGDSVSTDEKVWSKSSLSKVKILAVGHHGSKTSSSDTLLANLTHLAFAVASCRFEKYGHPHQEVIQRLKKHRIPLLTTEDWGNIRYVMANEMTQVRKLKSK